MHKYNLTIGDTVGEGHDKTQTFVVTTNLSASEIARAYKEFVKMYKIGFHDQKGIHSLFTEHEDRAITSERKKLLAKAGIDYDEVCTWPSKKDFNASTEDFPNLFFAMIEVMRPDFEWDYAAVGEEEDLNKELNRIGSCMGYGLIYV